MNDEDPKIEVNVFGRTFQVDPSVAHELKELEETGCITTMFAETEEDENGECEFGVFRIRFTPREIYLFVDAYVRDTGEPFPEEIENVYCGHTPWRYERLDEQTAKIWRARTEEIRKLYYPKATMRVVESEQEE